MVRSGGPRRILIVEDTSSMAEMYRAYLKRAGHDAEIAGSGEAALEIVATNPPDAMVLDLNLPQMSGFDVLRHIVRAELPIAVVVVTSDASISTAVEAMREGAYDFLVKPFAAARFVTTVQNAVERVRLREEVDNLREGLGRDHFCGFIGASLSMQRVYSMIEAAAPSNVTVFITGESGTGKEVAAEAVHHLSARRNKPFVAINCGAIPKDLTESELFGHRKGSFTGAIADRTGAVEQAHGGTLFLDELCEMPLDVQTKLLRFLQSGTYRAVGASHTQKVDVRIVCATNRDPLEEVRLGRFREDLYYRLHVVPIAMPPLRDREDDALLIADALLERFAKEDGKPAKLLSADARSLLRTYDWPGNIRQLQNVLRNAVVLNSAPVLTAGMLPVPHGAVLSTEKADGHAAAGEETAREVAFAADLLRASVAEMRKPASSAKTDPGSWTKPPDIMPLDQVERAAIHRAIDICQGNIPRAAALLGVNPSTIYRKKQNWDAA